MVKDVEELSAKLEPDLFMRPEREEVLDEPGIHIGAAGSPEGALTGVSKGSDRGEYE